jgi:hypothetical protein
MRTEKVIIPYRPRPLQKQLHKSLKRFNVIVCHRRFGKTVFAINEAIRQAFKVEDHAPRIAYIAPLYKQAKAVAWDYLKHFCQPIPGRTFNEAELRVDLPNGARIQLFGGDSPDSLRGIYLDLVILDEYAQMSPRLWSEIIRPTLSDRKGKAIFIGTPRGHNQFYELYREAVADDDWLVETHKASETGIVDDLELASARKTMTEAEYLQEYECSWQAAIRGAYYGNLITDAEEQGRICSVPYDDTLPVETWWDLGVGDSTSIWFAQRAGMEIRLIDYYEMTGEGLPHYARILQNKGYIYGRHVAPHDIKVRELGSGKSRKEIGRELGIDFTVAPRQSVEDGIQAVRALLPKAWFDAERCQQGLEALRQYRSEYDDRLRTFKPRPLHDWTSHAADAMRYGALVAPETEYQDDDTEWGYQEAGWMA